MNLNKISLYFEPKSILDIGANIGQFYYQCIDTFPQAYYYLVEGNINCEVYLQSINADYSIALLSDSEKEVNFYTKIHEPVNTGNSIYKEDSEYYTENLTEIKKIKTTTLDNLLSPKTFDLIKIDVQGSELDIINGGLDTINRAKGIILEVPFVQYNLGAPKAYTVYNSMKNLGFLPVEILENIFHSITNDLIQQDILFIPNH